MDNKNQRQSDQGQQGRNQNQGNQQRKNEPAAQRGNENQGRQQEGSKQQSVPQSQRAGTDMSQSGSQQSGRSGQTITNQDEQRQATNSGDSSRPMGEEETEGDRQRQERLKPYTNVGDDSGETDKKSPTMK